jgi:hypothetical protein
MLPLAARIKTDDSVSHALGFCPRTLPDTIQPCVSCYGAGLLLCREPLRCRS